MTVTAEVDATYPETGDVQFEDKTGHDSFDKALQHSRMVILKKRTEEYIHRHDITKGRKKFMSNASHRLKIKLLDSKIKERVTRNNERVIQVAASKIQEVFREYRQRKTRNNNTEVVHPKNSYKYASMESGIALALIVLAVAVATASFVSTTTAVGLVSVVIAGTAAVGFVSITKELSCRPGWFRLPVQYSSILFCMTIFAIFNVVAADGSSPNKNHGSSHIAAAVSAACLVAVASIRPRRTVPVCTIMATMTTTTMTTCMARTNDLQNVSLPIPTMMMTP